MKQDMVNIENVTRTFRKMKTIVRKPLMIKINKLRLRNLDKYIFMLWLTESEQATPVDSIKDVVRSSVNVPKLDKHLKKAGGHISRNVVEITLKMKTIVRKPLMIKNQQASSQKIRQVHFYVLIKSIETGFIPFQPNNTSNNQSSL